jgi:hypothetical protein
LVVIGRTENYLFTGLVLSNSIASLAFREMENRRSSNGGEKIFVLPRSGHDFMNRTHPDNDNYVDIN